MMKIIGFCGLPGSGKSTAIEAIEDLGKVVTMGDVIREEAKKRGLEPSGDNLGKIARELREEGGPEIIAQKCVDWIQSFDTDTVFIDGLRSMHEVKVFRQYWDFPIIAVLLDEELRFERLAKRNRSDDPQTLDALRSRDLRELGFGLREVIQNADYKIQNNISEKKFKREVREVVEKILSLK